MSFESLEFEPPYLPNNKEMMKEVDTSKTTQQFLSTVSAMPSANSTSNLDWALIHINQNLLSSVLGGPDSSLSHLC
jgi:hypothetical protein